MEPVDIFFKKLGNIEGPALVFIHGFMGFNENLKSLISAFGSKHCIYALDMRNHGDSPKTTEHTYELMVADVVRFLEKHRIVQASFVGHSMGGKVVMKLAGDTQKVHKGVVLDIAPREYSPEYISFLQELLEVDLNRIFSKKAFLNFLMMRGIPTETALFFTQSAIKTNAEEKLEWRINVPYIIEHYQHICEDIGNTLPVSVPMLFLRGEKSHFILPSDEEDISHLFPQSSIVTVPRAGHLVHADNLLFVQQEIAKFLS